MSSTATRRRSAYQAHSRHEQSSQLRTERSQPLRDTSGTPRPSQATRHAAQRSIRRSRRLRIADLPARGFTGAVIATGLATLFCLLAANLGLASAINAQSAALGFDPDRALFIQSALMALIGSFGAGCVLRWRLPAWLGAALYFAVGYLIPFALQAQHPAYSAYGAPQLLVQSAFVLNVATQLAVGFTMAAAGSVLGQTAGDSFVKPIATVHCFLLANPHVRGGDHSHRLRFLVTPVLELSLACLIASGCVLIGRNIGTILSYGTTATLYQPVQPIVRQGTIRFDSYRSPALGGSLRQFLVYLPPSYGLSSTQRFPVIYLLHGEPGSLTDWFRGANVDATANDLFAAGKAREAVLVSPDGNGSIYRFSEWANSLDGRQRMEDSLVDDLVPYVDAHYRTLADPAGRVLAGNSDGGYGAVNIALHHPGVFGAVMSLGGFYNAARSPVFGSGAMTDSIHQYNSPAVFVETSRGLFAARSMEFIIGVATQDHGYFRAGMLFYQELRQLGMHVQSISVSGGHSWQTWGAQFAQALPMLEPPVRDIPRPHEH